MFPIRDTIPARTAPVLTGAIIVVNALVFLIELGQGPALERLIFTFGMIPARTVAALADAPYRLDLWLLPFFTSMFLHGGWIHIIGNMWFLWVFGDNVEDRFGRMPYLAFYLSAGIAAAMAQFLVNPASRVPMVGASGAIAGVLGAYTVLFPHSRVLTFIPIFIFPYFIRIPAVFFLGIWFFEQLLAGGISLGGPEAGGGVAWWAHAGGFSWGLLVAAIFRAARRGRVDVVIEDGDDWIRTRRRDQWPPV